MVDLLCWPAGKISGRTCFCFPFAVPVCAVGLVEAAMYHNVAVNFIFNTLYRFGHFLT